MIFRSLQYRIAIVFVGLLILVMALMLAMVTRSNERIVAAEMTREISAGALVFKRVIEQNRRQLETAATVLSADFAFRDAIATQDQPTIRSVLRNHGARIGAKVMMVINPAGELIADTQRGDAASSSYPVPDLLAVAETQGMSTDFKQMRDGQLYQMVLVPILAPRLIAWVAMGFPVDDRWAVDLSQMTGLTISVVRHDDKSTALLASSLDGARRLALPAELQTLAQDTPKLLSFGDEHFQTLLLPLGKSASVVLQRSLEQAEAPYRSMQNALYSIVMGAIAMFVLGSILFSRRIAGPVNQLAAVAKRIQEGDYAHPVPTLPPDEIGQLAVSLDRMRQGIAEREQKILKLAYEDTLTGLANRVRFLETFDRHPKGTPAAIAVLDLDRFAMINDALGHPIGDRLLGIVGERLANIVAPPGLVARLWGDEFAFLLMGADEAVATRFAELLHATLRAPFALDGQRLDVGGSLGIALCPQDGQDANTLLRRAELAMYLAKRKQIGFVLASGIGGDPPHEHLSLIGEMREALDRLEFVVHYQPKLDPSTGRIKTAEALLRWQHPAKGLLPPLSFIPFAEQTGFIREITPWLLGHVIAQTARWRAEGLIIVPSINISARDLLNPELVEQVRKLTAAHELPPDGICLEITESALMEDPALALEHLNQLAAYGTRISIDDYGSGQASLAYLKTLPVHELKIDQTFIRSVIDSPKDAAIVNSTILLGHALGLKVVAEGAETSADLEWLRNSGCDEVQGYGIARPMPAAELPGWIAAFAWKLHQ
ncbi:MAG: EAL domain-containing protein [Proteobacteria bacterium]|nr:EAL domain-containing protein [Pseudomonadota bacterium]